jgi:hypothetical protein
MSPLIEEAQSESWVHKICIRKYVIPSKVYHEPKGVSKRKVYLHDAWLDGTIARYVTRHASVEIPNPLEVFLVYGST